ncbi:hypothetical protein Vretifemale_16576 [Volvox reticuliferus]|uniref:Uncharacterized protein n=1 Tax=Volvox reticuliferus TaxID=1737510 RepID=A0A8J4CRZ0_9CHLO|nr:hypothetical protein Vretifemale_16576 [Volvox reticuliferus]
MVFANLQMWAAVLPIDVAKTRLQTAQPCSKWDVRLWNHWVMVGILLLLKTRQKAKGNLTVPWDLPAKDRHFIEKCVWLHFSGYRPLISTLLWPRWPRNQYQNVPWSTYWSTLAGSCYG